MRCRTHIHTHTADSATDGCNAIIAADVPGIFGTTTGTTLTPSANTSAAGRAFSPRTMLAALLAVGTACYLL